MFFIKKTLGTQTSLQYNGLAITATCKLELKSLDISEFAKDDLF